MLTLDWIKLSESFGSFKGKARELGLFYNEISYMEKEIARLCPIPVNTGKNQIVDQEVIIYINEIDKSVVEDIDE